MSGCTTTPRFVHGFLCFLCFFLLAPEAFYFLPNRICNLCKGADSGDPTLHLAGPLPMPGFHVLRRLACNVATCPTCLHALTLSEKFDAKRNAASLAARCRWGMRNGLFYVAKSEGSDRVLGVAMWLPPRPAGQQRTWAEVWEGWRFWANQVGVNLWYGRGGLKVKVSFISLVSCIRGSPSLEFRMPGVGRCKRASDPVHRRCGARKNEHFTRLGRCGMPD